MFPTCSKRKIHRQRPCHASLVRALEAIEPRILLTVPGGFSAAYFNNADLTDPVTTTTVPVIDFNWGKGIPAPGVDPSTFSARWTGFIKPQFTETYTFITTADDGVRLSINGQTLIDHWVNQPSLPGDANDDGVVNFTDFQMIETQFGTAGPQSDFNHDGTVDRSDLKLFNDNYGKTLTTVSAVNTATMTLVAGQTYSLSMDYFQNADLANAKLEWQSASQSRQDVTPASAGSVTGTGTGGDGGVGGGTIVLGDGNGLYATYYDNPDFTGLKVSRIDQEVAFAWSGQRPTPRIDTTTFSVRWEGQVLIPVTGDYTFSVNSDDGTRLWVDNQPVIDVWGDKSASEYPSDPIHLVAGQKYNIKLEYYQNQGDAIAELKWGGPVGYGIIPTSQLFPTVTTDPTPPAAKSVGDLRVSDDGHFIVKTDGTPFFWLAATAWALFNATTRTDVDTYLQDRAGKEFTVTQAVLYNPDAYSTNEFNQPVFLNGDPSTPNPVYFQHVDYVLQEAHGLGMYVELLPTWGDAVAATDSRKIFNTTNADAYGLWLGTRYASQPNIIWDLGGDWPASTSDIQAVWQAMAAGLQAGDGGTHLITYHPVGGHSSTEYFSPSDTWLAFNEIQSGHTQDSPNYNLISNDYNDSPTKPVVDAEPNYEDIPNGLNPNNPPLTDYDVRKKTYWALFAGAFGAAYGNYEVYQFYSGNNPNLQQWQDALNDPGAGEMRYARWLMQSRPYVGRVPDQSLIVGSTLTATNHIQATRGGDGSYAFIYSASGQDFTVDLTKLSGSTIDANWFNPRDGTTTYAGQFSNGGTQSFSPPSSGTNNDWILILDDDSKAYPAPGPVTPPPPTTGGSDSNSVSDSVATIPYRLFAPQGVSANQKVPLILYLHGMGERGTDNNLQTTWMGGILQHTQAGQYAAYVLAPQINTDMWFQSYNNSPTEAMKLTMQALQQVISSNPNIDISRIYVTGVSMGGMGVWDIMRWMPNQFAAAVPMSGAADPSTAAGIKNIPVWAFQGGADTLVPPNYMRAMIQALKNAGGSPLYTEIAGAGHVIWDPIYYDASNTLFPWLFAQQKAVPTAPIASAPAVAAAPPKPAATFSITPVVPKKPNPVVVSKPATVFNSTPATRKAPTAKTSLAKLKK